MGTAPRVKVSPFFAAFGNVAMQLDAAGADAVVLFNRFYQPDIDIATLQPFPHAELSTSATCSSGCGGWRSFTVASGPRPFKDARWRSAATAPRRPRGRLCHLE
jgi:hypothetical protein